MTSILYRSPVPLESVYVWPLAAISSTCNPPDGLAKGVAGLGLEVSLPYLTWGCSLTTPLGRRMPWFDETKLGVILGIEDSQCYGSNGDSGELLILFQLTFVNAEMTCHSTIARVLPEKMHRRHVSTILTFRQSAITPRKTKTSIFLAYRPLF